MDDPLSAVDSYVGKEILDNCILNGPMADRTRILVTHALHILDKTDYIYLVDNGEIKEQGSYESLRKDGNLFSRLMEEYGSIEEANKEQGKAAKVETKQDEATTTAATPIIKKGLMQDEERNVGGVSWSTYNRYLKYAGGIIWGPVIVLLIALSQGAAGTMTLPFFSFALTLTSIPKWEIIFSWASGRPKAFQDLARLNTWRFTLV